MKVKSVFIDNREVVIRRIGVGAQFEFEGIRDIPLPGAMAKFVGKKDITKITIGEVIVNDPSGEVATEMAKYLKESTKATRKSRLFFVCACILTVKENEKEFEVTVDNFDDMFDVDEFAKIESEVFAFNDVKVTEDGDVLPFAVPTPSS